jgi:hypothetical protein
MAWKGRRIGVEMVEDDCLYVPDFRSLGARAGRVEEGGCVDDGRVLSDGRARWLGGRRGGDDGFIRVELGLLSP